MKFIKWDAEFAFFKRATLLERFKHNLGIGKDVLIDFDEFKKIKPLR